MMSKHSVTTILALAVLLFSNLLTLLTVTRDHHRITKTSSDERLSRYPRSLYPTLRDRRGRNLLYQQTTWTTETVENANETEVGDKVFAPVPISHPSSNTTFHWKSSLDPNGDKRGRPRLILHVGPAKTATTSLQTDLTRFQDSLAVDGFTYMGRFYNPYINGKSKWVNNRTESDIQKRFVEFGRCHVEEEEQHCLQDVQTLLNAFMRDNHSKHHVIISDESFDKWTVYHYKLLRKLLGSYWTVEIVVGYRHYFDWLLSRKYQIERVDRAGKNKYRWKHERGSLVPLPLFPQHWAQERRWNSAYTSYVVQEINHTFPVTLVSLHDPHHSIRTNFLCSLPSPTSCERSLSLEDAGQEETAMNTQRKAIDHRYYDAIALAAVDKGMVNASSFFRDEVRKAVEWYQEEDKGLTLRDLPLWCPREAELQELLRYSLSLEKLLYPHLKDAAKQLHKAAFRKRVQSKAFCWIDTDAILQKDDWKSFFRQFSGARGEFDSQKLY